MKLFIVYGIDDKGRKVIDGFEAENNLELHTQLNRNQYIPIKTYEVPDTFKFLSPVFTPHANTDQIIELLDNLNIILQAGIPITQGLKDIEEDLSNENTKKLVRRISTEVDAGTKLSVACKPYEKYFTPTIINLMTIGEETGKLPETLHNGAEFLRKVQFLKKSTKKALFTPIISLVLIILAIAAWMAFVVPGMVSFFKDMDTELPPLTVFLIDASAIVTSHGVKILIGLIIFIIGYQVLYKHNKKFRMKNLQFFMKMPLFSKLIKFFNIAFISEYLHLGLKSGLTLYETLHLLRQSVDNDVYNKDLKIIIKKLEQGDSFSSTTKDNPLYTNFVTRVLEIGEVSGTLEIELERVAKIFYTKVDDLTSTIPKVVQPLTLLIGGGFMALIMLGLMGPIYDLIGKL